MVWPKRETQISIYKMVSCYVVVAAMEKSSVRSVNSFGKCAFQFFLFANKLTPIEK
jgi:hypothetical protein